MGDARGVPRPQAFEHRQPPDRIDRDMYERISQVIIGGAAEVGAA